MYVVDASVALKWLVEEEDSDKALRLCDDALCGRVEIAAPDILFYETANILIRKMKLNVWRTQELVCRLLDTNVAVSPPDPDLLMQAVEIAGRTGASVYDAAYVALARDLHATLVTADRGQARTAEEFAQARLLESL